MNKIKVLIIGSTGMLGSAVGNYFLSTGSYDVTTTYRNSLVSYGPNRIEYDPLIDGFSSLGDNYDYVVNCLGTIKPFMSKDPISSRFLNALYPWHLANWCAENQSKLIHITTDCVFSGLVGDYIETDVHDAPDEYGKSKSLGEPIDRCMVLRTSIVGEEIHKNASLLEWAKSQKGNTVSGFTNHFWNGTTTKQYAINCDKIIKNNMWSCGLFHVFSNKVNKFEMLTYFNERFNLGLDIKKAQTPNQCDRSLKTIKSLCSALDIPSFDKQVLDI